MARPRVLVIVLAGGGGKRLIPLTVDRAKPAVPFGGIYRPIDFSLSNMINSGFLKVVVPTQYKSHSLDRRISKTWRMSDMLGNHIAPVPAQQRMSKRWFLESADTIYRSLNLLDDERSDYMAIAGANNICRMGFSQMLDHHIASGLPCTVAGIRRPRSLADQFGVIGTDPSDRDRIKAFVEKPKGTPGLPDSPNEVLASMGSYTMDADALLEAVTVDTTDEISKHDMGGNIVSQFVNQGAADVYDFKDNDVPDSSECGHDYWRGVGTVDAFFEAHQDLISVTPVFNLYDDRRPLFAGYQAAIPPAKFTYDHHERLGHVVDSVVSPGVIVSGGEVISSALSPGVRVNSWPSVRESVIMDGAEVGRSTVVNRAILGKYIKIEEGVMVGIDPEHDRERGFTMTKPDITVVAKEQIVTR